MSRLIRVRASRTFQQHNAGDVFLVAETREVEQLVKAKLFEVLAIEQEATRPEPVAVKAAAPVKAKRAPRKKKSKTGTKNV